MRGWGVVGARPPAGRWSSAIRASICLLDAAMADGVGRQTGRRAAAMVGRQEQGRTPGVRVKRRPCPGHGCCVDRDPQDKPAPARRFRIITTGSPHGCQGRGLRAIGPVALEARAPRMQPPRQRKAEPVPTRWRNLAVPKGLARAYHDERRGGGLSCVSRAVVTGRRRLGRDPF